MDIFLSSSIFPSLPVFSKILNPYLESLDGTVRIQHRKTRAGSTAAGAL
jgi:hypothetical protein